MKKFKMKEYSFNDVKPISLDEIKGGTGTYCCRENSGCNENTNPCCDKNTGCNKNAGCLCNSENVKPPCNTDLPDKPVILG